MKKTRLLLIVFAPSLLVACNSKPKRTQADITKDTLTYTYQEVKQKADDCGDKPGNTGCGVAQINYPVFASQSTLTDTITRKMLILFDNDPDRSLQTMAKNFIKSYDAWKKVMKQKPKQSFKLNLSAKIVRQDSALATVEIDGSSFAGNKHPVSLTKFINWNTKEERPISLNDVLISGYKEKLTPIAEAIFRKSENLKDTSSLARDYFFKNNKFELNDNFIITPVGIRFLYNPYEIKPYAAGSTDLFIPYAQIKQLIKPCRLRPRRQQCAPLRRPLTAF